MNNQLYNKYFSTDLAKLLKPDSSYLNNRQYFDVTDEDILSANMFISVFEAGDKFECNNENIGIHTDITSTATNKYPQLLQLLSYYCKVYNCYRNYAWKQLCGSETYRNVLVEKFFFWLRDVRRYGMEMSPYSDMQIYEQVASGCFTIKPFVKFYLQRANNDNIIILPRSQKIVKLSECTIYDILKECNRPLCQYAINAESAIADALNRAIEEMDEAEE